MVASKGLVTVLAAIPLLLSSAPSPAHSPVAAPRVVHVIARNYAFQAPDTITAGVVTLHLMNQGTEPHHVWVLRFAPGHTAADFMAALKADPHGFPSWVEPIGGPNAPAPGANSSATLAFTPGSYAFVCFVPSPNGTPDGVPHVMKGMVHALTVIPAAHPVSMTLPRADVRIDLADYRFNLSHPLTAGHHVIRVTNSGTQPHEVEIVKLAPGKTPQDVVSWFPDPKGPPPGTPMGGVVGIVPGVANNFTMDLAPGDYGLICFLPDARDGKPHFMHGMMTTLHVK